MFAFPGMLVSAAKQAGIRTPKNPDDFDPKRFPHFAVFCTVQLGRRMRPGEHWENAKVIASVPTKEIKTVTLDGLIARGLQWST